MTKRTSIGSKRGVWPAAGVEDGALVAVICPPDSLAGDAGGVSGEVTAGAAVGVGVKAGEGMALGAGVIRAGGEGGKLQASARTTSIPIRIDQRRQFIEGKDNPGRSGCQS